MNIADVREQVEGRWYLVPITYITVGDAMPTKADQNDYDQIKQRIYFVDDAGEKVELIVYGLEPIVPQNGRIVYKIKLVEHCFTGQPTDITPPPLKISKPTASAWDIKAEKIAYGKTKCRLVCSAIESGQLVIKGPKDIVFWAEVIFEPRKEQENESEH